MNVAAHQTRMMQIIYSRKFDGNIHPQGDSLIAIRQSNELFDSFKSRYKTKNDNTPRFYYQQLEGALAPVDINVNVTQVSSFVACLFFAIAESV